MSTKKPAAITARHAFLSCNVDQAHLFSVNPGVPADDALAMASCLLGDALRAMEADDAAMSYAAHRLVQMAKAVVDSVTTQPLVDWAQGLGETGGVDVE